MVDLDAVCEVPDPRSRGGIVGVRYNDYTMAAIDEFLLKFSLIKWTGLSTLIDPHVKSNVRIGEAHTDDS